MTEKIKGLYKKALKNELFLVSIKSADNDEKPKWYSSELEKNIFATVYYGWLVGLYGNDWKENS